MRTRVDGRKAAAVISSVYRQERSVNALQEVSTRLIPEIEVRSFRLGDEDNPKRHHVARFPDYLSEPVATEHKRVCRGTSCPFAWCEPRLLAYVDQLLKSYERTKHRPERPGVARGSVYIQRAFMEVRW